MAEVSTFHKLIVAGVFAAMVAFSIVIASLEKPSCESSSQESVSVSICKAFNGG